LLNAGGTAIVQTLHPVIACGDAPYVDGWRAASWAGFGAEFHNPAPWYFRTMEGWQALFAQAGFQSVEVHAPIHPDHGKPLQLSLWPATLNVTD
jgi:hypothetical protein